MIKSITLYTAIHLFNIFSRTLTSSLYHTLLSHLPQSSSTNCLICSTKETSFATTFSGRHAGDQSESPRIGTLENLSVLGQCSFKVRNRSAKNQDSYNE